MIDNLLEKKDTTCCDKRNGSSCHKNMKKHFTAYPHVDWYCIQDMQYQSVPSRAATTIKIIWRGILLLTFSYANKCVVTAIHYRKLWGQYCLYCLPRLDNTEEECSTNSKTGGLKKIETEILNILKAFHRKQSSMQIVQTGAFLPRQH